MAASTVMKKPNLPCVLPEILIILIHAHPIAENTPEKVTAFLPLVKDSAGERFKSALIGAVQEAKK